MRTTHPDWDMSFAGDSEEALEQLEKTGADVIVSDAQMPGVDGLALLQLVRMRYPETARIMLTGQVKKEQTYEAVGLVHQFLAKPVPPTELQAAIDRALHLGRCSTTTLCEALFPGCVLCPASPTYIPG